MKAEHILIRSFFAYVAAFVFLRLTGKRTIGNSTVFDFVLLLIIGDLFDDVVFAEVPVSQFVIAFTSLVLMQTLSAVGCYYSKTMSRLIQGRPIVLMENGSTVREGMEKEWIKASELYEMLRQQQISKENWSEVELAQLEQNGNVSVIKYGEMRELQKCDLKRRSSR